VVRLEIDRSAFLCKRADSRVWYLDLTEAGHRSRLSLHTTLKDHALSIARRLTDEARARQWGIPLLRASPFREALDEYRAHAAIRNTPRTVELNLSNLERFRAFLLDTVTAGREPRLSEISPDRIESYVARRKQEGLSHTTINRDLGTLSTFFNFAVERGRARANPVQRVKPMPVPKRFPRTLEPEQVSALLFRAGRPVPLLGRGGKGRGNVRPRMTPLRDMILFAVNTGARLGEMLYMEWSDDDLKAERILFRNKPENRLKDHADRQVRANEAVLDMLRRRKLSAGGSRWVFPSVVGGG